MTKRNLEITLVVMINMKVLTCFKAYDIRGKLNEELNRFSFENKRITNFEMETSALYGLSAMLGHEACTVCAIIANRFKKAYSKDYKKTVNELIVTTLDRLTS